MILSPSVRRAHACIRPTRARTAHASADRSTSARAPAPKPRRGVAVVLALVAVSVATLLGLSIATTRDATVATSDNLAKVARARAAAAGEPHQRRRAAALPRLGDLAARSGRRLGDGMAASGASGTRSGRCSMAS